MRRSRLVTIGTVVSVVAAFGVAPVAQAAEVYFLRIQASARRSKAKRRTLISPPHPGPSTSSRST